MNGFHLDQLPFLLANFSYKTQAPSPAERLSGIVGERKNLGYVLEFESTMQPKEGIEWDLEETTLPSHLQWPDAS